MQIWTWFWHWVSFLLVCFFVFYFETSASWQFPLPHFCDKECSAPQKRGQSFETTNQSIYIGVKCFQPFSPEILRCFAFNHVFTSRYFWKNMQKTIKQLKNYTFFQEMVPGEPATGTARSCVSGELCVVTGIVGRAVLDCTGTLVVCEKHRFDLTGNLTFIFLVVWSTSRWIFYRRKGPSFRGWFKRGGWSLLQKNVDLGGSILWTHIERWCLLVTNFIWSTAQKSKIGTASKLLLWGTGLADGDFLSVLPLFGAQIVTKSVASVGRQNPWWLWQPCGIPGS